ncbi:Cytochrome P450 4V2 [Halocaridina rubra]|uniref:Cytochrome P450 4V2 n=1 Tax=Halocaridina rubra TaxID=373956 RepID=A0AAN9A935_HALRR
MVSIVQQRQARPWLQPDFLFKLFGGAKKHDACLKILHQTAYKAIRERRRDHMKTKLSVNDKKKDEEEIGNKKRLAFLDLLLEYAENEEPLSDEDIREEVDTFMFEGHDTTAAAINWSLYLLGCNPKIQPPVERLRLNVLGCN